MTKRSRQGMTLVEVLACLAVAAILAAVIISATSKVIESSRRTVGASNLRQLGSTIHLFVADFGFFPPGAADDLNENLAGRGAWYDIISPYLGAVPPNTSFSGGGSKKPVQAVLDSPAKAIPTDKPMVAFIANRHVMPDRLYSNPDSLPPAIRPTEISRPSDLILLMDGVQHPETGQVKPYTLSLTSLSRKGPKPEWTFAPFPNIDDGSSLPRFRHWDNPSAPTAGSMQALFCDGHVDYIRNGELKYKHIVVSD